MKYFAQLRKDLRDPNMLPWQILLAASLALVILGSANKLLYLFWA